jgi:CHAT domain-containing protein/Flp pilus assembly protein TadD
MNRSVVRSSSGAVLLAIALTLTGSASFSHAHTDPRLRDMLKQGLLDWQTGAVLKAAATYRQAYRIAIAEGDVHSATVFLNNIGGIDFAMFHYQDAVHSFLEARSLAEKQHDSEDLGQIALNLASLYIEQGDDREAERAAEQGLQAVGSRDPHDFRCQLLIVLGKLRALQHGRTDEAVRYFHQAIEAATFKKNPTALARAWYSMGEAQLDAGELNSAEESLQQALKLRLNLHDPALAITYERLSELKLARHDPESAAELLAAATSLPRRDAESPLWPIYLLSGRILLAQGRPKEALNWFHKSIESAIEWREEVAPSDALRSSANTLVRQVGRPYSLFVETSLSLHSNPAVEAFLVTEEYRAAALRQTLTATRAWRKRLPPEYWQTLKSLRGALFEQFANDTDQSLVATGKLQQSLMEMETRAGLSLFRTSSIKTIERSTAGIALRDIQRGLTQDETLLSFYAGDPLSALWAITDRHIELHLLQSGRTLSDAAKRFRGAVETGSSDRDRLGEDLYAQLFKDLSPAAENRPCWLIAAADEMFDIPLAALVAARKDRKPVYLIERHAIERIPSALMLRNHSTQLANGPFIGVADGIYNLADPRWRSPRRRGFFGIPWPGMAVKPSLELTRLVGSADEINACARKWDGDRPPVLLTGLQASREALESALRARPAVIHLAAHVLKRPDKPEDALIALGLSVEGQPEGLTGDDIANFEVPGAMVVMNGCASAGSPAVSGTGVMGLTRAWIMAGAQTVVGTRWPIPDDTGELFQLFYSNWKNNRGRATPRRIAAESLQRAQRAVLDANTWRSDPKYWGAFYVVGKE